MAQPTAEQLSALENIAEKLGCTVQDLLQDGKDPAFIIESFNQNQFKVLNE